jgi:hypothetical protein
MGGYPSDLFEGNEILNILYSIIVSMGILEGEKFDKFSRRELFGNFLFTYIFSVLLLFSLYILFQDSSWGTLGLIIIFILFLVGLFMIPFGRFDLFSRIFGIALLFGAFYLCSPLILILILALISGKMVIINISNLVGIAIIVFCSILIIYAGLLSFNSPKRIKK